MKKINKTTLYLLAITALQFFIQGTWSMTLGLVFNNNGMGEQIRIVFFLLGIATIASPLFIGYISDKFKYPKKILSLLHILNAINMIGLYFSFIYSQTPFIIFLIFLSGVLFYPTTALVNSLTFQNITSDAVFPIIRSFGTIGFMISGFFIGLYNIESSFVLYPFASFFSVIISFISFIAPFKSNPMIDEKSHCLLKSLIDAMNIIVEKNAVPYLICALLMMISQLSYSAYMPVYLDEIGFSTPSILMQTAVLSELAFMLCLSSIMEKIKIELLMLIGILTYALRSLITINLHSDNYPLIIAALVLQGISWVFFFISFDIFIKKISYTHNQHQMQGLKVIFINGLGVSVSSLVCGYVFNNLPDESGRSNWAHFWYLPFLISAVSFIIIILSNRKKNV